MESRVVSCPPCRELLDVKTAAGLPSSELAIHKSAVVSKKCFIGLAIFPNRVALPKASPAQLDRSCLSQ